MGLKILSEEQVSIIIDIITQISHFFTRNNPFFYLIQTIFRTKTGNSLIDFDVNFQIQSSDITKSLNFGSNLKKNVIIIFLIFQIEIDFYGNKYIFLISNRVDSVRSESDLSDAIIFPIKPSKFTISLAVKSYGKKNY